MEKREYIVIMLGPRSSMASIHKQDVISFINVKHYYIAATNDLEITYFITNCIAEASLKQIKFHTLLFRVQAG